MEVPEQALRRAAEELMAVAIPPAVVTALNELVQSVKDSAHASWKADIARADHTTDRDQMWGIAQNHRQAEAKANQALGTAVAAIKSFLEKGGDQAWNSLSQSS